MVEGQTMKIPGTEDCFGYVGTEDCFGYTMKNPDEHCGWILFPISGNRTYGCVCVKKKKKKKTHFMNFTSKLMVAKRLLLL